MSTNHEDEYQTLFAEIDRVLSDRTHTAIADRATLRDAVCVFVLAERTRGTTLRSLIRTVKEILRKAEEKVSHAKRGSEQRAAQLAKQLVDWCMEFHRSIPVGTA